MSTVDNTNIVGTKTGPQLVTEIQTQIGNANTELDLRPESAQNESITGSWTFSLEVIFSQGVDITGSIAVTTGDMAMEEQADHVTTPSAGIGIFWVRDDAPCKPMFTDDTGIDHDLTEAEGPTKYIGQVLFTGTAEDIIASHAGKMIDMANASPNVLTIPSNAAIPIPVDTRIDICQSGAGLTTVAITDDTLLGNPVSRGQYHGLSLWKKSATVWIVFGGTTA